MKKIITLGSLLTLLLTGCTTTKTEQKVNNNTFLSMAKINDTTYEVTANVTPVYATNKHLTWNIDFAPDASSQTDDDTWKVGKTASSYVGLAVSEDTAKATLTLKEGFASQILVTAAITEKPSVKASVKVDYEKRLQHTVTNNYKLVPATNATYVNPFTFNDSVGTVEHSKVITYEYSNKFYWYGGSQTTPVEWTETIQASRGEGSNQQQINLLFGIGENIAINDTATFDFKAQTYIFRWEHASSSALDDLAYAVKLGDTAQAKMYRNKGATIALGYKVFVDGVQISTGNAPLEWSMTPIDFSNYTVSATSLTLTDTTIIF